MSIFSRPGGLSLIRSRMTTALRQSKRARHMAKGQRTKIGEMITGGGERHRAGVRQKAGRGRRAHRHRRRRAGRRDREDGRAGRPAGARLQMRCRVGAVGRGDGRRGAEKFGRCDILINCAGIFPQPAFDQMKFADWRRVLSINLDSVFLVSSAFAPGMKQRGWGRVVSMASSTFGSGRRPASCTMSPARAASSASRGRWRASSARTASPSTRSRRA